MSVHVCVVLMSIMFKSSELMTKLTSYDHFNLSKTLLLKIVRLEPMHIATDKSL